MRGTTQSAWCWARTTCSSAKASSRSPFNSYEDIDVVGAAADAPELLATAAEHVPDVVVTDIKMPPNFQLEGIDCAHEIRKGGTRDALSALVGTRRRGVCARPPRPRTSGVSRTC